MRRPPRLVVFTFLAAVVAFCIVQDRVTAAGAERYVALQRAALVSAAPPVTIDAVVRPAVYRSVQLGLLSSAGVIATGFAAALVIARRRPGE